MGLIGQQTYETKCLTCILVIFSKDIHRFYDEIRISVEIESMMLGSKDFKKERSNKVI